MTEDGTTALFYEMFTGLPRQGPGDAASTRRALSLVPGIGPATRMLDIGCGTGAQSLVLARQTPAHIVAIDNHAPFIASLRDRARALGLAERIDARVADMRDLALPSGAFDLVWSEGAIFVVGFERGLREWRRLLAPGGHLAVTDACWTRPDPPADAVEFWRHEYPAIRTVPETLDAIVACGYETVGHFTLPPSSWWNDYYRPLQENVMAFRARHRDEPEAHALADAVQREIDVWHAAADAYSYEFFVMRPR